MPTERMYRWGMVLACVAVAAAADYVGASKREIAVAANGAFLAGGLAYFYRRYLSWQIAGCILCAVAAHTLAMGYLLPKTPLRWLPPGWYSFVVIAEAPVAVMVIESIRMRLGGEERDFEEEAETTEDDSKLISRWDLK